MDLVLNDIRIEEDILTVVKALDQMADFNENDSEVIGTIDSEGMEKYQLNKIISGINRSIRLLKGVKDGSN